MENTVIRLPEPSGIKTELVAAMRARSSTRSYGPGALGLSEISHLL